MRRLLALTLAVGIAAPGCASMQSPQVRGSLQSSPAGQEVMADYARNLAVGTRVRVTTVDGDNVRGTLLKKTDASIFVQPRGRIAEPLAEITLDRLVSIEREKEGAGIGRAIGLGAAAGAGAALGVFFLLVLAYSD